MPPPHSPASSSQLTPQPAHLFTVAQQPHAAHKPPPTSGAGGSYQQPNSSTPRWAYEAFTAASPGPPSSSSSSSAIHHQQQQVTTTTTDDATASAQLRSQLAQMESIQRQIFANQMHTTQNRHSPATTIRNNNHPQQQQQQYPRPSSPPRLNYSPASRKAAQQNLTLPQMGNFQQQQQHNFEPQNINLNLTRLPHHFHPPDELMVRLGLHQDNQSHQFHNNQSLPPPSHISVPIFPQNPAMHAPQRPPGQGLWMPMMDVHQVPHGADNRYQVASPQQQQMHQLHGWQSMPPPAPAKASPRLPPPPAAQHRSSPMPPRPRSALNPGLAHEPPSASMTTASVTTTAGQAPPAAHQSSAPSRVLSHPHPMILPSPSPSHIKLQPHLSNNNLQPNQISSSSPLLTTRKWPEMCNADVEESPPLQPFTAGRCQQIGSQVQGTDQQRQSVSPPSSMLPFAARTVPTPDTKPGYYASVEFARQKQQQQHLLQKTTVNLDTAPRQPPAAHQAPTRLANSNPFSARDWQHPQQSMLLQPQTQPLPQQCRLYAASPQLQTMPQLHLQDQQHLSVVARSSESSEREKPPNLPQETCPTISLNLNGAALTSATSNPSNNDNISVSACFTLQDTGGEISPSLNKRIINNNTNSDNNKQANCDELKQSRITSPKQQIFDDDKHKQGIIKLDICGDTSLVEQQKSVCGNISDSFELDSNHLQTTNELYQVHASTTVITTSTDKTSSNSPNILLDTPNNQTETPFTSTNKTTLDELLLQHQQQFQAQKEKKNLFGQQPSKYTKIYTKKAWIQNYDLEDQQRQQQIGLIKQELSENIDIDTHQHRQNHVRNEMAKNTKLSHVAKSNGRSPDSVANKTTLASGKHLKKADSSNKSQPPTTNVPVRRTPPRPPSTATATTNDSKLKQSDDEQQQQTLNTRMPTRNQGRKVTRKASKRELAKNKKGNTATVPCSKRKRFDDKETTKNEIVTNNSRVEAEGDNQQSTTSKKRKIGRKTKQAAAGVKRKLGGDPHQVRRAASGRSSATSPVNNQLASDDDTLCSDSSVVSNNGKDNGVQINNDKKNDIADDDDDKSVTDVENHDVAIPSVATKRSAKKVKRQAKKAKNCQTSLQQQESKSILNGITATATITAAKVKKISSQRAADKQRLDVYKRSGETFLQFQDCAKIVSRANRCLECRQKSDTDDNQSASRGDEQDSWDHFCRFFEFRKLRYNENARIVSAGFLELEDASDADKSIWQPKTLALPHAIEDSRTEDTVAQLTASNAEYILKQVGNEFCAVVQQERAACELYERAKIGAKTVLWKRFVEKVREMCDTCYTTIFNCHFTCETCGFVVCIDCYTYRAHHSKQQQAHTNSKHQANDETSHESAANSNQPPLGCDAFGWVQCTKSGDHTHDKLTLTKIITGTILEELSTEMHMVRDRLGLEDCACESASSTTIKPPLANLYFEYYPFKLSSQPTSIATGSNCQFDGSSDTDLNVPMTTLSQTSVLSDQRSTLRELLLEPAGETAVKPDANNNKNIEKSCSDNKNEEDDSKINSTVTDVINDVVNSIQANKDIITAKNQMKSFFNDNNIVDSLTNADLNSKHINNNHTRSEESKGGNKDVSKMEANNDDQNIEWLCDGRLLVVDQLEHERHFDLFRHQWIQGKPVLVRNVHEHFQIKMWSPTFFVKQFGDFRNQFVDCRNGQIHPDQPMKKYWEGFERQQSSPSTKKQRASKANSSSPPNTNETNCNNNNDNQDCNVTPEREVSTARSYFNGSALWKLKDWPSSQDFNELLPDHFADYMQHLPLRAYTTRTGQLNLAARLPSDMLRPDLGPKMYSAYGSSEFVDRGTTNLHLDISDAINVLMYVANADDFEQAAKTVADAQIDEQMKKSICVQKRVPGAIWHVFKTSDTSKLREFLKKVSHEKNIHVHGDPIHDQIWYLNEPLLERLRREHNVEPFAILQCMGDAIVIPAGAPHQVKNLRACTKVASDFVSPENVGHCLRLTNEFRSLPESNMNHEDKLQIKNILYHTVKDCVKALTSTTNLT